MGVGSCSKTSGTSQTFPGLSELFPIKSRGNESTYGNEYRLTVSRRIVDQKVLIELHRAGHTVIEIVDDNKFNQADRINLIHSIRDRLDRIIRQSEEEFSINLTP